MLPRPCASSRPTTPSTHSLRFPWLASLAFSSFIHESLPAKTVAEFLTYVRANPGRVNYATGNGTSIFSHGATRDGRETRDAAHPVQRRCPGYIGPHRRASASYDRDARERYAASAGRKTASASNLAVSSKSAGAGDADCSRGRLETGLLSRHGQGFSVRHSCPKKLSIASRRR